MTSTDPGPRDHLITRSLRRLLEQFDPDVLDELALDPVEGPDRLSRHAMGQVRDELSGSDSADDQTARVNALLRELAGEPESGELVALPPRVLQGIKGRSPLGDVVPLPSPPATPLGQSDLLVNAEGQPNIGSELRAELASADSVDLICAFVIWSGVRHLHEALLAVVARGGRVRVITTTYMGATEKGAVDALVRLGAEVHVALDARTTKLHAKAWLLERGSGLSTAFVGSSNLSHTALFDGLEWNVRLSSVDAAHVIDRVRMTFESHWASEHFERYDPEVNGDELRRALEEHDRRSLGEASTISFANLDVRPYPHQQRMLEVLTVERERHDRHRNLVVAATGTGKTVVAALDYRQLLAGSDGLSLLFVAHREEILRQSLATYRAVLRDGSFGEIHGGGRHAEGRHVFAMIQSLGEGLDQIEPAAFDVVVVDEFHHAAAATYDKLLRHLRPRELLGLTATPERLDGQDVTEWFDQRIAVELRLWEAIDQGFLVPFQYFGVADGTDLSQVTWRRGGYVAEELSNVLTNDDLRVGKLLDAIRRIVLDAGSMRALGFCVSKEHARYMARAFTEAGLESVSLTGDDAPDERARHLAGLRAGRLRCVFSVEVLGEGVDVPDVDCLLLLRPTSSSTVFTQQLGRGLRRAQGKSHLTVIDLIGQHRREFRFEDRLRAIIDTRRGKVLDQVAADFPFLPAGCTVDLDRQSRDIVLDNLKAAVRRSRWTTLVADLRSSAEELALGTFLDRHDHRLEDVYRSGSWTRLKRDAGQGAPNAADGDFETRTLRALGRLTHVDDPERVACYRDVLGSDPRPTPTRSTSAGGDCSRCSPGGSIRARRAPSRSPSTTPCCGGKGPYAPNCSSCSTYSMRVRARALCPPSSRRRSRSLCTRGIRARRSSPRSDTARAFVPRSPREASSGPDRPPATSSSSTSARLSATTHRRRCTATTRLAASSSTGSRSHGRPLSSQRSSATSTTQHLGPVSSSSSASARPSSSEPSHSPSSGRPSTSTTAASARWPLRGDCRRPCPKSSSR
jgi:superfamily II DNA or RNA helicase/HKD family nuclease